MSAQWADPATLRDMQEKKFRSLVHSAYHHVPYYRQILDEAGIALADIRSLDDIALIPVTSKATLQSLDPQAIQNQQFTPENLQPEHSSGSSGRPFSVLMDKRYLQLRNLRFLRALLTTGYRPGLRQLFLVADSSGTRRKPWLRWTYGSIKADPNVLLEQINGAGADYLYGCTTPLRRLAEYILETGNGVRPPGAVITTAEMLDTPTRKLLKKAFQAEVFDFYGLTEMGLVGWECGHHSGYHLSEDSLFIEFLPEEEGSSKSRLVMTNLDLFGMPLIRYETGDVAVAGSGSPCACGRTLRVLDRVEGRSIDCIELHNGKKISPYQITCGLEVIEHLNRYQVVQDDFDRFTITAETGQPDSDVLKQQIRNTIRGIVGAEAEVSIQTTEKIKPVPGRKFRVVESRIGQNNNVQDQPR
jgi:phenylacetate-CoA ligase